MYMESRNVTSLDIHQYLTSVEYPATKDDLVFAARDEGAPKEVIDTLDSLPVDIDYETPLEVSRAYNEALREEDEGERIVEDEDEDEEEEEDKES